MMINNDTGIAIIIGLLFVEIYITLWHELRLASYTNTPKSVPASLAVARAVPMVVLTALVLLRLTGTLVNLGLIVIASVGVATVGIFLMHFINLARPNNGHHFDGEGRKIIEVTKYEYGTEEYMQLLDNIAETIDSILDEMALEEEPRGEVQESEGTNRNLGPVKNI